MICFDRFKKESIVGFSGSNLVCSSIVQSLLLMTECSIHQPTNVQSPDALLKYYALRLKLPHNDWPKIQEVIWKYSKNLVASLHNADSECDAEHFHFAFLDLTDTSKVEALRNALKKEFDRGGNGFYSGKAMDNHVYKALQYMKHAERIQRKHCGPHWEEYIRESPDWDPTLKEKKAVEKRKREADPILSFSNVLSRALQHRQDNSISSTDLGVTLEHMTRTTNWIPSPQIMKFGLDPLHFKLLEDRASGRVGKTS